MTDPRIPAARGFEAAWFKSSYSDPGTTCVEIAALGPTVAVRDSKNPDGPALLMPSAAFESFITGVRGGGFDA